MADAVETNPLARLVHRILRRMRYPFSRSIAGKAVAQDADGTFQVQPDDGEYPPTTGVPPRYGIPGVTCKVAPGARCAVSYEDADPGRPVVTSWGKSTLQELVIAEGSQGAARVGDTVACGTLVLTVVAPGVLSGTYTDPFGVVTPVASGAPIVLKGKITSGSSIVKVGG